MTCKYCKNSTATICPMCEVEVVQSAYTAYKKIYVPGSTTAPGKWMSETEYKKYIKWLDSVDWKTKNN